MSILGYVTYLHKFDPHFGIEFYHLSIENRKAAIACVGLEWSVGQVREHVVLVEIIQTHTLASYEDKAQIMQTSSQIDQNYLTMSPAAVSSTEATSPLVTL